MASRERMIWVVQEIQRDMLIDTHRREGQPLTGHNVAVALGELSATCSALAQILETMLKGEVDGPEPPRPTDPDEKGGED